MSGKKQNQKKTNEANDLKQCTWRELRCFQMKTTC